PPAKDAGAPATDDAAAPAVDAGHDPVTHDDAAPEAATPQASQEGGCNVGAGGPGGVPWMAIAAVLFGVRRRRHA
ncbi:MAG TPA: MYXO-CTERM sorting domain-containing protein, partial [Polyangiaceae bacterium]